jgi:hypothetical protein
MFRKKRKVADGSKDPSERRIKTFPNKRRSALYLLPNQNSTEGVRDPTHGITKLRLA